MVRVTPVKLQASTKVLWFDPAEHEVMAGDRVIVSTERGLEFGSATSDIMEVSDELIAQLKSPLKPVIRVADEDDIERAEELRKKGEDALSTFKELAAETNEQMRPVMVEFLFDGDKAVFYFESEERIDFRDLVRKLASVFHVRVDMRQIGVRDGARMIGGLGHCGQELCCARLGGEFSPVSIRMAKEQNLSLNPQKISGCCGRLMCCLRYEYEAYKEVNARAPKLGAKIDIPDGVAKVTEINVPLEQVTLQLDDERFIKVPLSEMEAGPDSKRPSRISQKTFEAYANPDPLTLFESAEVDTTTFTVEDKVAEPKASAPRKHAAKQSAHDTDESTEITHRKPRRRHRSHAQTRSESAEAPQTDESTAKQKTKSGSKHTKTNKRDQDAQAATSKTSSRTRRERRKDGAASSESGARGKASRRNQGEGNKTSTRKPRRSSHTTSTKSGKSSASSGEKRETEQRQRTRRRPGQKSSGVRNAQVSSGASSKQHAQPSATQEHASGEVTHRKPRRRRHKAGGTKDHAE